MSVRSKAKQHNHTGRGKSGRRGAKLAQRRRDRRAFNRKDH